MQNGGLSSILQNPYNFLSGGGITSSSATAPGSSLLKNSNVQLSRSQISNLWANGPPTGLMGNIPRMGPYGGAFGMSGNMSSYMPRGPMMTAGAPTEDDEIAAEDEEDMGVIETYSNYMPAKLKIGKPHPDPVVETASLASVEPPDVWYDLGLPDDCIDKGKLSALQLETITYTVSPFVLVFKQLSSKISSSVNSMSNSLRLVNALASLWGTALAWEKAVLLLASFMKIFCKAEKRPCGCQSPTISNTTPSGIYATSGLMASTCTSLAR